MRAIAARLAPENVRRMHQSLHHLVADAPWSDETMLQCVRGYALAAMGKQEPVVAWIIDAIAIVLRMESFLFKVVLRLMLTKPRCCRNGPVAL